MKKTFTCKVCNCQFVRKQFPSSTNRTFEYCSHKCCGVGKKNKDKKCLYCGKEFHPIKKAKYCSRICFSMSTRGRKAKNSHPENIIEYVKNNYSSSNPIDISNKLNLTVGAVRNIAYKMGLKINPQAKRINIKKANDKNMMGENNPNWKGGITYLEWGNNWEQQRKLTRERDNYKCQVCGFYSKSIHVHHIIPRRFFAGHVEDSNVLSNLICLCRKHHILVEMKKIPCPKVKA